VEFDFLPAVTLLGGTVGGYITFSGAHRLLDAGVKGIESLPQTSRSAVSGILIAALMRVLLFLAVLGVVVKGTALDPANPPASAFAAGAGQLGYKLFGVVLWSAAALSALDVAIGVKSTASDSMTKTILTSRVQAMMERPSLNCA
jgi:Mn2+/Fe2+ NRAMP family transporter